MRDAPAALRSARPQKPRSRTLTRLLSDGIAVSHLILALGLVLAVEGLVLALAPRRIEDALRLIASLGVDQRR
ncbi:MAG: DUF2065 domain-containing protein, partial [Tabrizicola sp.]